MEFPHERKLNSIIPKSEVGNHFKYVELLEYLKKNNNKLYNALEARKDKNKIFLAVLSYTFRVYENPTIKDFVNSLSRYYDIAIDYSEPNKNNNIIYGALDSTKWKTTILRIANVSKGDKALNDALEKYSKELIRVFDENMIKKSCFTKDMVRFILSYLEDKSTKSTDEYNIFKDFTSANFASLLIEIFDYIKEFSLLHEKGKNSCYSQIREEIKLLFSDILNTDYAKDKIKNQLQNVRKKGVKRLLPVLGKKLGSLFNSNDDVNVIEELEATNIIEILTGILDHTLDNGNKLNDILQSRLKNILDIINAHKKLTDKKDKSVENVDDPKFEKDRKLPKKNNRKVENVLNIPSDKGKLIVDHRKIHLDIMLKLSMFGEMFFHRNELGLEGFDVGKTSKMLVTEALKSSDEQYSTDYLFKRHAINVITNSKKIKNVVKSFKEELAEAKYYTGKIDSGKLCINICCLLEVGVFIKLSHSIFSEIIKQSDDLISKANLDTASKYEKDFLCYLVGKLAIYGVQKKRNSMYKSADSDDKSVGKNIWDNGVDKKNIDIFIADFLDIYTDNTQDRVKIHDQLAIFFSKNKDAVVSLCSKTKDEVNKKLKSADITNGFYNKLLFILIHILVNNAFFRNIFMWLSLRLPIVEKLSNFANKYSDDFRIFYAMLFPEYAQDNVDVVNNNVFSIMGSNTLSIQEAVNKNNKGISALKLDTKSVDDLIKKKQKYIKKIEDTSKEIDNLQKQYDQILEQVKQDPYAASISGVCFHQGEAVSRQIIGLRLKKNLLEKRLGFLSRLISLKSDDKYKEDLSKRLSEKAKSGRTIVENSNQFFLSAHKLYSLIGLVDYTNIDSRRVMRSFSTLLTQRNFLTGVLENTSLIRDIIEMFRDGYSIVSHSDYFTQLDGSNSKLVEINKIIDKFMINAVSIGELLKYIKNGKNIKLTKTEKEDVMFVLHYTLFAFLSAYLALGAKTALHQLKWSDTDIAKQVAEDYICKSIAGIVKILIASDVCSNMLDLQDKLVYILQGVQGCSIKFDNRWSVKYYDNEYTIFDSRQVNNIRSMFKDQKAGSNIYTKKIIHYPESKEVKKDNRVVSFMKRKRNSIVIVFAFSLILLGFTLVLIAKYVKMSIIASYSLHVIGIVSICIGFCVLLNVLYKVFKDLKEYFSENVKNPLSSTESFLPFFTNAEDQHNYKEKPSDAEENKKSDKEEHISPKEQVSGEQEPSENLETKNKGEEGDNNLELNGAEILQEGQEASKGTSTESGPKQAKS